MSGLTWQQRNALAKLATMSPLAKGDVTYTPGPPQFADLATSILGNVGTNGDGFDALFNLVASTIDGDISSISTLDTILADVGFIPGALDAAVLAPIVAQHAAFLAGGDAQLAPVDAGLGTPAAVAPPAPPRPHHPLTIPPDGPQPLPPWGPYSPP